MKGERRQHDIEITGIDPATKAVTFAKNATLIDEGLAVDLEIQSIPEPAKSDLSSVDLVTSTGCIGYVTEKSFEQLLPAISPGGLPWIANFVLRQFPFDAIEQTLSNWGYITEKLENQLFTQRRFADTGEQKQMIEHLDSRDIDSTGKEADGFLYAEFYLSRPAEDARKSPLSTLLTP